MHLIKNGGEQYGSKYLTKNPLAQVPCLIHNHKVLTQSMAIIQYLDDFQPSILLFPKDREKKALVLNICEIINSGIQPLQNLAVLQYLKNNFQLGEDQKNQWVTFWIQKGLFAVEQILKSHKNYFSLEDSLTAADLFIVPQLYSARRWNVDLKPYPHLLKIEKRTHLIDAFQKAHPKVQPDTPKISASKTNISKNHEV